MANSISKTRTNFVGITDFEKFKDIISHCVVDNGAKLTIIENTDSNNVTKYGFYVEENICGMREHDESCNAESCTECKNFGECDMDCNYDAFLKELQQVIAPGDALLITTFCYKKICYLQAYVDIITSEAIDAVTLETLALNKTRKMLGDKDWTTENDYGKRTELD